MISHCKALKSNLKSCTGKLIDHLISTSAKTLTKIKEIESFLSNFTSLIFSKKSIDKEDYEWVISRSINETSIQFENPSKMLKEISEGFELESFRKISGIIESNEVVFGKDITNGGLFMIDLASLKLSKLDYASKTGAYVTISKIDEENYFCTGGFQSNSCVNGTGLVNIKKNTFDVLPSTGSRGMAGSAYVGNKIYVFGGSNVWSTPLNTCEVFDLDTKNWSPISPMPMASYHVTAAPLGENIIVSGFQCSSVYSYSPSGFTSVLDLHEFNTYKIVTERWVLTAKFLYENLENNTMKWMKHELTLQWAATSLFAWNCFRNKQNFYFLTSSNELYRINTKSKKVERILYS